MNKLSDLPNISSVNEKKLQTAGISTAEELKEVGSREAFLRIRTYSDPEACLNTLYSLEGAIQEIRWHNLSQDIKDSLKDYFNSL